MTDEQEGGRPVRVGGKTKYSNARDMKEKSCETSDLITVLGSRPGIWVVYAEAVSWVLHIDALIQMPMALFNLPPFLRLSRVRTCFPVLSDGQSDFNNSLTCR